MLYVAAEVQRIASDGDGFVVGFIIGRGIGGVRQ